jgi:hypothetical protein
MTADRNDVSSEDIEWRALLDQAAAALTWSELSSVLYRSGVLVSEYLSVLSEEDEWSEVVETGDVSALRALLTESVRDDRFSEGEGESNFWDGLFDEILAALANRVHLDYEVPRRVLPCPTCGDTVRIQTVVFGMPAGMPSQEEEDQYYFAGCVMDDTMGTWYCPACDQFYSPEHESVWASDELTRPQSGQG